MVRFQLSHPFLQRLATNFSKPWLEDTTRKSASVWSESIGLAYTGKKEHLSYKKEPSHNTKCMWFDVYKYTYIRQVYIYIIINYIYRREGAIKQVCWDPPWGFASHLLVYLCMLGTPILWAAMGCHNHPKLNKTDKGINGISFCLPHDPLPFAIQNEACILPRSKNQDNHLGQDSRLPVPSMGH